MKQYTKFKLSHLVLCLGLSLAGVASAEQASEVFEVKSFQLVGDVASLSEEQQLAIAKVLKPYQVANQSLSGLQKAKDDLTAELERLGAGKYTVALPEQEIIDGNVYLQLVPGAHAGQISYKGTKGYTAQNVEQSLPSLKQDKKTEEGLQWFDKRELNMALENPLKATRVHYDIDVATQQAGLAVAAYAPFGKTRNYVTVDNYGSREFDYARVSAAHINANLTGKDDVLTVSALTNFSNPAKSYAVGASYQRPFYDNHQSLGAYVGFSNLDSQTGSDVLPQGISQKIAKGRNIQAGLKWSYYLPQLNVGVKDQLKVNAGYEYRNMSQDFSIDAASNNLRIDGQKSDYSVAGVYAGLSGEIKPTLNSTLNFDASQHYYSDKVPGTSKIDRVAEFDGKATKYSVTRYGVSYDQDFAQGWNFNTAIKGQHSNKPLANLDQDTITGAYGVRGFRYGGLSGDKTLTWKTELSTPRYTSANIGGYAFYDWGKTSHNSDLLTGQTVSSAGVGIKARSVLDFDFAAVRRLQNHEADRLPNGKVSNRNTFWGKITYFF